MGSATIRRNIGLDILRAAAIVMVMLSHGVTLTGIPVLGEFGTGVDLFFVLSGFLIGRIYFRTSKSDGFKLRGFWVARWWRTLPPYAAGLLLYLAVRHVTSVAVPQGPLRWYYAFFLQNYLGVTGWAPTWSLCVEEHFYLALPLLALPVDRWLGRRAFGYLLPGAFFVPLALRVLTLELTGLPANWYWMTHLHCEGMIAGLWLAYIFVERREAFAVLCKGSRWLLPLVPALLVVVPLWHPGAALDVVVFTLLAIGYSAWLCFAYGLKWEPVSAMARGMRWSVQAVALAAYSLYLTHTTVNEVLRGFAEKVLHLQHGVERTGFVLVGSLVVGAVFFLLVERPSILLRNRMMHHEPEQTLPVSTDAGSGGLVPLPASTGL